MGTKKISQILMESLFRKPQTFAELKTSLSQDVKNLEDLKISLTLAKLQERRFVQTKETGSSHETLYCLTSLGQAVLENPQN